MGKFVLWPCDPFHFVFKFTNFKQFFYLSKSKMQTKKISHKNIATKTINFNLKETKKNSLMKMNNLNYKICCQFSWQSCLMCISIDLKIFGINRRASIFTFVCNVMIPDAVLS